MVGGRLFEDARAVVDAAALGVVGTEDDPAQAGEGNGLGAHRARLQRHVERGPDKAFRTETLGGVANGEQLGMGRRIVQALDQIVRPCQDLALLVDQHGTDRHLARRRRRPRFLQRQFHGVLLSRFRPSHDALNTTGLALGQASR